MQHIPPLPLRLKFSGGVEENILRIRGGRGQYFKDLGWKSTPDGPFSRIRGGSWAPPTHVLLRVKTAIRHSDELPGVWSGPKKAMDAPAVGE